MAYREDVDYQALINEAIAAGDYRSAAQYEQSRNEKINALNAANGGTNKYGATATNNYSNWLNGGSASTGSATGVGTFTGDQQKIKDEMNANSMQWYDASDEAKASLHAENEYLASLLGDGVTWDSQTGYWSGDASKPTTSSGAPTFDYGYYQGSRPTYESSYSSQIDDMLNKILNREAFSYNAEEDPLFQQYREQYNREGQRAMNDTLASVASGAGGMNSYAVTAASQANDSWNAQLMDRIPELYEMAYQMYLDDIEGQVRDLGLLQGMDDTQYNRYRDTMADWRDDRDFAYGAYRDDMGDYQWQQNFDYNAGRDSVSDGRYESETAYDRAMSFLNAGVMPDASVLAQAGISNEEAERVLAALNLGGTSGGSTSGGNGGGNGGGYDYTNGGMSTEEIMAIQRELGVTVDGLWGPNTQAAYEAKYGSGGPDGLNLLLDNNGGTDDTTDLEVDMASVSALGYGPISADRLAELEESGAIESYEENGKIKFRKVQSPVNTSWLRGNVL